MLYAVGVACFGALLAPSPLLSGSAGAAAVAAPRAGGVSMNLAEGTVNVGIIGAGRIGLTHLDALGMCKNANPIIISNPTVSKAEAASKAFPGMEFTSSDRDVINHPDVEAVWICSPSQFHSEQITACADAGKHVFCEKPLATDLQATIEAVNYCRSKGVKLMTALQRRFDPNFVRIKQAIVTGEIGEPIIVKLCSRDPAPPPYEYVKGGGGIFKDMAVHVRTLERARVATLWAGRGRRAPLSPGAHECTAHECAARALVWAGSGHGAFPDGVRARQGTRDRLVQHRQVDRRPARTGGVRHGVDPRAIRERQGRHHRRLPPGQVRVRPARRSPRVRAPS